MKEVNGIRSGVETLVDKIERGEVEVVMTDRGYFLRYTLTGDPPPELAGIIRAGSWTRIVTFEFFRREEHVGPFATGFVIVPQSAEEGFELTATEASRVLDALVRHLHRPRR